MKRILTVVVIVVLTIASLFVIDHKVFLNKSVKITYPWRDALFPADFTTPTFEWKSKYTAPQQWSLNIASNGNKHIIQKRVATNFYTPTESEWDSIKQESNHNQIYITIAPEKASKRKFLAHRAQLTISISNDSVNAPILYREIPLPFNFAERNAHLMRYSLCDIGNPQGPDVVLDKFRACGNCHSFSGDGSRIALDFDAPSRDKGGYFITDIDSLALFTKDNHLSWSKMVGKNTFGMLSKISWDGKHVVTTTKDRAVSEKFDDPKELAYSQLFFPINGVLTVYNIDKKELKELPGANDMDYVQTNAIWTPDDKHLIFARAKAIPYHTTEHLWDKIDPEIIQQFIKREKEFKFDLYIIPFNEGRGGIPVPIPGASNNGKSNYFPAISPDGKWLVFCQAENYMMLQPDSKLYITNLETGKTSALKSNFNSMNSWHSWSPNGKWLVYVSKALGPYTNLFLTHIDQQGRASVPVMIQKAEVPERALNYPEFVNRNPKEPFKMVYDFVDVSHIMYEIRKDNFAKADSLVNEYLKQSTFSTPSEYQALSDIMTLLGRTDEAKIYHEKEIELSKAYYESLVKKQ